MKKWNRIKGGIIGRYGWELWENLEKQDYYLVKVFIYDKVIDLTGDRHILELKLKEIIETFQEAENQLKDHINHML